MTGQAGAHASTRLVGHSLIQEGWGFIGTKIPARYRSDHGMGKCECGAMSEMLPSIARRKAWHRAHKDEIKHDQPNLIKGGA